MSKEQWVKDTERALEEKEEEFYEEAIRMVKHSTPEQLTYLADIVDREVKKRNV